MCITKPTRLAFCLCHLSVSEKAFRFCVLFVLVTFLESHLCLNSGCIFPYIFHQFLCFLAKFGVFTGKFEIETRRVRLHRLWKPTFGGGNTCIICLAEIILDWSEAKTKIRFGLLCCAFLNFTRMHFFKTRLERSRSVWCANFSSMLWHDSC